MTVTKLNKNYMQDYLSRLTNSECLSSGLKPHRSILYQLMQWICFTDLFQKGESYDCTLHHISISRVYYMSLICDETSHVQREKESKRSYTVYIGTSK